MSDSNVTVEVMDWWKLEKLGTFMTSCDHKIVLKKESIPIVFVPGIMGSRLKRNGKPIWDPDAKGFMVSTYMWADPKERQKTLIGAAGEPASEPDDNTSLHFQRSVEGQVFKKSSSFWDGPKTERANWAQAEATSKAAVKQGWGSVAWGFYGQILQYLAAAKYSKFDKVFNFPVYAVGYNWVGDNTLSGAYVKTKISDIIKEENKKFICEKVIVVTHSMGGIVSREASRAGASDDILGIIHGAQPVLGAPVAYRRMRAGTQATSIGDWGMSQILGSVSKEVMPVLGNSIGALELLPTSNYKTNDHKKQWLRMTKDGKDLEALPDGDPYVSIYQNQTSFLRLAYHPEYISPLTADTPPSSTSDPIQDAVSAFLANLDKAKSFHDTLKLTCHQITYSSWVGDEGLDSWDKIEYRYKYPYKSVYLPDIGYGAAKRPKFTEGEGLDLWEGDPVNKGYYEIQPADAKGDGTVPRSSGCALWDESAGTGQGKSRLVVESVEHAEFYNDDKVQKFTFDAIMQLAKKQFDKRMK